MTTLFEFAPTGTIVDGTAVPTSSSQYDLVDAGVVYDTGVKLVALTETLSASAEAPNPAGTTERKLTQVLPAPVTTRRWVRILQVESLTSAAGYVQVCRWLNGSSPQGEVRVTTARKLSVRDMTNNSLLATSTPTITFGQPFRFELDVVEQAGATPDQVTMRLYLDPLSDVPDQVLGPFSYNGGAFDRIVDGIATNGAATTVRVLYAADGDTENPSITRFVPTLPPDDGGSTGSATVAYDSGGTVEDGQTGSDNAFTVVIPATLEAGDTVFVCLSANTGSGTIPAPPANFSLITHTAGTPGPVRVNSNVSVWVYAGIVGTAAGQVGAPGATVTFTMDTGGLRTIGVSEGWDGVDLADILANLATRVAVTTVSAAITNPSSPALTAPEDGTGRQEFWIGRIGAAAPSPTLTGVPATHTAQHTSKSAATASPNISVVSTRRTANLANAAASGGQTGTWSTAVTGFVIGVLLPPATVVVPPATNEGVRTYLVTPTGEVLLTSTELV